MNFNNNMFSGIIKTWAFAFIPLLLIPTAVQAQELPPLAILLGQPYIINEGDLFKDALYISDFECLVEGKNWQREAACDYYSAIISERKAREKSAKKVCFKESTRVSNPKRYLPDETYRLTYYTAKDRAHILSDELYHSCLLYTSPSPRDATLSRMPSSA